MLNILLQIRAMGVVPLCSAQYERLFNTCRIPGIEAGKNLHVFLKSSGLISYFCKLYPLKYIALVLSYMHFSVELRTKCLFVSLVMMNRGA